MFSMFQVLLDRQQHPVVTDPEVVHAGLRHLDRPPEEVWHCDLWHWKLSNTLRIPSSTRPGAWSSITRMTPL